MYIHHTWEKGEHKIGAGSHNFSKWNTTTTTASGRKQHGEGMDSLEKHLKGKKKRFKELRESDQKEQYKVRYSHPGTVGNIEEMKIFATSPELAKESVLSSFKSQAIGKVVIHGTAKVPASD